MPTKGRLPFGQAPGPASVNGSALGKECEKLEFPFSVATLTGKCHSVAPPDTTLYGTHRLASAGLREAKPLFMRAQESRHLPQRNAVSVHRNWYLAKPTRFRPGMRGLFILGCPEMRPARTGPRARMVSRHSYSIPCPFLRPSAPRGVHRCLGPSARTQGHGKPAGSYSI